MPHSPVVWTGTQNSGGGTKWLLSHSRVLDALFGQDSDNEAANEININFHGINALPNTVSSSTIQDQGYQQSINRGDFILIRSSLA